MIIYTAKFEHVSVPAISAPLQRNFPSRFVPLTKQESKTRQLSAGYVTIKAEENAYQKRPHEYLRLSHVKHLVSLEHTGRSYLTGTPSISVGSGVFPVKENKFTNSEPTMNGSSEFITGDVAEYMRSDYILLSLGVREPVISKEDEVHELERMNDTWLTFVARLRSEPRKKVCLAEKSGFEDCLWNSWDTHLPKSCCSEASIKGPSAMDLPPLKRKGELQGSWSSRSLKYKLSEFNLPKYLKNILGLKPRRRRSIVSAVI
ncbi:hypothetical protein SARC_10964 [Sphaeroforma arctica JP610]|uniref:Uncharacterized protein n=1 Tax=Sphaeroforma arctica JP610 TaxID=667725 RepID=A0A0L0FIE0_9EUKA|nr:hypothetical protein SARC_10964 [Sphaeroforma arctica JP610]KNC76539.1 hypothetical protein SARC_10964 [Sphaeroforma arctica JP610]|eukprot:XP_014150441.1 hypothetical protein SARC_10964 [Sphaeroforma arctica JP610]